MKNTTTRNETTSKIFLRTTKKKINYNPSSRRKKIKSNSSSRNYTSSSRRKTKKKKVCKILKCCNCGKNERFLKIEPWMNELRRNGHSCGNCIKKGLPPKYKNENDLCKKCGDHGDISIDGNLSLKCGSCNRWLHYACAKEGEEKRIKKKISNKNFKLTRVKKIHFRCFMCLPQEYEEDEDYELSEEEEDVKINPEDEVVLRSDDEIDNWTSQKKKLYRLFLAKKKIDDTDSHRRAFQDELLSKSAGKMGIVGWPRDRPKENEEERTPKKKRKMNVSQSHYKTLFFNSLKDNLLFHLKNTSTGTTQAKNASSIDGSNEVFSSLVKSLKKSSMSMKTVSVKNDKKYVLKSVEDILTTGIWLSNDETDNIKRFFEGKSGMLYLCMHERLEKRKIFFFHKKRTKIY